MRPIFGGPSGYGKLMRQWLTACLRTGMYFTVEAASRGGLRSVSVYQYLAGAQKNKKVQTFLATDPLYLFEIVVQEFVLWGSLLAQRHGPIPSTLDVYTFEAPKKIDILSLAGGDPSQRGCFKTWRAERSDVEGSLSNISRSARNVSRGKTSQEKILRIMDSVSVGLVNWTWCPCNFCFGFHRI